MGENEIGSVVVGAALKVHSRIGPGLLESAYRACLEHELARQGLKTQRERPITFRYEDVEIEKGYRIDLLVNEKVVVELKAIETVSSVHRGQLLSYLRLGGYKLGYLLNFNVAHMRDGITRMVNGTLVLAYFARPLRTLRWTFRKLQPHEPRRTSTSKTPPSAPALRKAPPTRLS